MCLPKIPSALVCKDLRRVSRVCSLGQSEHVFNTSKSTTQPLALWPGKRREPSLLCRVPCLPATTSTRSALRHIASSSKILSDLWPMGFSHMTWINSRGGGHYRTRPSISVARSQPMPFPPTRERGRVSETECSRDLFVTRSGRQHLPTKLRSAKINV